MKRIISKVVLALLGILLLTTSAQAATIWRTCTPTSTATFTGRVHVKCSQVYDGIRFFAVRASDAGEAARFLSTVNAALLAGYDVSVAYDPVDTSGNAWGCDQSDCRRAVGLAIVK